MALEHAALMRLAAFAGAPLPVTTSTIRDATRLRMPQGAQQRGMRLRLGQAVQIEPRIDLGGGRVPPVA